MPKFILFDEQIINVNFIQKIITANDFDEHQLAICAMDDEIEQAYAIESWSSKEDRDERFDELVKTLCGE